VTVLEPVDCLTENKRTELTALRIALGVQKEEIAALRAGLRRSAEALTHVFTWSTDSAWIAANSVSCTFTEGVRAPTP